MIAVYGAGAVGLTIGARLSRAGADVLLVTRRPETAREIAARGVRVEDVATREAFVARPAAVCGVGDGAVSLEGEAVLFCMRSPGTEQAARALAAVAPGAVAVSLQNDVDNEEVLARHFSAVAGGVVRQTSTRVAEGAVVTRGGGRLVLGAWAGDATPASRALARACETAGYDVGISERIGEDKWLKLCINLMSAPNALVRREDHERPVFAAIKVRLLEEAREVLDAAGIRARSCDGRDRSLDAEIAWQREAPARGGGARRLPLYNQVWAALRRGGPLEADRYHRRLLDLAAAHGVRAPQNARVALALARAYRERRGPECVAAEELEV